MARSDASIRLGGAGLPGRGARRAGPPPSAGLGSATIKTDGLFACIFRFAVMPLMLFSGTFFPLSQLPAGPARVAYATPLWHGVALSRAFSLGTAGRRPGREPRPRRLPGRAGRRGHLGRGPHLPQAPYRQTVTFRMLPPAGRSHA